MFMHDITEYDITGDFGGCSIGLLRLYGRSQSLVPALHRFFAVVKEGGIHQVEKIFKVLDD